MKKFHLFLTSVDIWFLQNGQAIEHGELLNLEESIYITWGSTSWLAIICCCWGNWYPPGWLYWFLLENDYSCKGI